MFSFWSINFFKNYADLIIRTFLDIVTLFFRIKYSYLRNKNKITQVIKNKLKFYGYLIGLLGTISW